ncbi:MAG: DUF4869 domain-containing protein [Lachnospiraceae bacterium]|nr:DUF4869 domain-containing protein [Lachnospiraceae bacterium]
MLNLIFQRKKANGKMVISDSRQFFNTNKKAEWFQESYVQKIMEYVDGSKLIDGFCLKDRNGMTVPPEYLSTGAKTAILVWEYPDIIFNMTQCGDNAFQCVAEICRHSDRTELTYRYLPLWAMEGVEIQKDGIAITKELYNEKIDDWLEEIYND